MHLYNVLHETRVGVIDVGFVRAVGMSTFYSFMIFMPPNPFGFHRALAVQLVIVVSLALGK